MSEQRDAAADLQTPATEGEIAELVNIVRVCPWTLMTVRKLAFERDSLKAEAERLRGENETLRKELSCSAKAVDATDDCIASVMRCADHLCDKIQEYHDQKVVAEMEAERLRLRIEELELAVSTDDDE